ncbi:MAG TPA: phosphohydrolase [Anaerolineae bacterium]|nr:phosphohydrolase [Anaerolineae bacterium]
MIERVAYRTRQFLRALTASLVEEDLEEVEGVLTPPQRALFLRMPLADRRHGLAVYRALQARGGRPRDLLVAALLHDVGKAAAPLPLWVRVAVVLLERFAPRLLERLGGGEARGWRRPFVVYRRHAEIGAEWAAQAGCSPLTVGLIRRHQEAMDWVEGEEDRLLALLQEVDGSW